MNRNPLRRSMLAAIIIASCLWTSREALATRRYVNQDARGESTGRDWANAYTCLQAALLEANDPTSDVDEIWVAMGTYRPGPPSGDRDNTFAVVGPCALIGGFVGNEAAVGDRNPSLFPTVLSGDLNDDDAGGLDSPSRRDNVKHVVTARGPRRVTLDGFTITGGVDTDPARSAPPWGGGAGVRVESAQLRMNDCVVVDNSAAGAGGGLFAHVGSEVVISRTLFIGNAARDGGAVGGMASAIMVISESAFVKNTAQRRGAGIFLAAPATRSGLRLLDSCVLDNRCGDGGDGAYGCGVALLHANARIDRSMIAFNTGGSGVRGAGMAIDANALTSVRVTDSIIGGNTLGGGNGERQLAGLALGGSVTVEDSYVERFREGVLDVRGVTFVGRRNSGLSAADEPAPFIPRRAPFNSAAGRSWRECP